MKSKKIKIILSIIIIIIIAIILGIVITKKLNSKKAISNNNTTTMDLSSVFETEDISELDTEQTKNITVASKYGVGSQNKQKI